MPLLKPFGAYGIPWERGFEIRTGRHTIFSCTVACPREIEITKAIGDIKKAITTGRLD